MSNPFTTSTIFVAVIHVWRAPVVIELPRDIGSRAVTSAPTAPILPTVRACLVTGSLTTVLSGRSVSDTRRPSRITSNGMLMPAEAPTRSCSSDQRRSGCPPIETMLSRARRPALEAGLFGSTSPITGGMKKSIDETTSLGERRARPGDRDADLSALRAHDDGVARRLRDPLCDLVPVPHRLTVHRRDRIAGLELRERGRARWNAHAPDHARWDDLIAVRRVERHEHDEGEDHVHHDAGDHDERALRTGVFDSNQRCSGIGFGPNGFIAFGS